jgi:hypothetical protein
MTLFTLEYAGPFQPILDGGYYWYWNGSMRRLWLPYVIPLPLGYLHDFGR